MARKVKVHDNDAPEISAAFMARMRPMKAADPGMVAALKEAKAARGRPKLEHPKAVVSVRLSAPAKQAWDGLPAKERARIVAAMEKAAIKAVG